MRGKKNKKIIIALIIIVCIGFLASICGVYAGWKIIFANNISKNAAQYLYIPQGSDFETVKHIIENQHILKNPRTFFWLTEKRNYKGNVHSGKYRIEKQMSNLALLRKLRSGYQEPVEITFHNIRTKASLSKVLSSEIELDSAQIYNALINNEICNHYGLDTHNILCLFLPDTYEVWWDMTQEELLNRMQKEFNKFWTQERREKATLAGLTPVEVIILASIVEEENHRSAEQPRIAGLYINRLKRGMRLQADPTVKFAVGDFTLKQVLKRHLKTVSPYNTYLIKGLPPGPICIPSKKCIDNVLNYEKNDYIYMCAKEDLSGYHNFAKTGAEHARNSAKYHKALKKYLKNQKNKSK
ncbi:MAG: endolytic transglycosylase MltG [Bacteroidales bacterium]|nr:endolytic transglycosylase MltG [Bacteroidales bacterium]